MIKAVIFDCFGVLTSDTWKEFLSSVDSEKVDELRSVHAAYDRGLISYEDFRATAIDLTGSTNEILDAIFFHRGGEPKNTQLLGYIEQLHQNYKVGILSNAGTAWIKESFLSPKELRLFDDMVLSFEVSMSKPDPAIFRLACERLSVLTAEAIFVDDLSPFCEAAREVGMQAVTYTNFEQFKKEIEQILADTNN